MCVSVCVCPPGGQRVGRVGGGGGGEMDAASIQWQQMDTSGGGREEEMKEMGAEMEGKWK